MSVDPNGEGFIPELEQSLLGALLLGQGLARVRPIVRAEHFVEPIHQDIFGAICDAHERSGSHGVPLVAKLIPERVHMALKLRTDMNVLGYLSRMAADTVHGGSLIEKAAKAVVEQWARLNVAVHCEQIAIAARDPAADPSILGRQIGSAVEGVLSDVRGSGVRRSRFSIGQAAEAAIASARAAKEQGHGLTGLSWGLTDVNRLTGGMQRKDLILVGARPSMGKTSLLISSALATARAGHGIGILSMEMDAEKLTARALSDLSFNGHVQVPYASIIRGQLDDGQFAAVEEMGRRLDQLPIAIDEASGTTFDIRVKIETMMEQFERAGWPRLECLMVDHLGFVQPSAHYRGNRNNEVGEITRALKGYAKEYGLAIVLLSQLSRQLTQRDDKRPQLSDLRDSGNIEQDADVVVFLHREAYYLDRERATGDRETERVEKLAACQHQLEFIIAKQRNGPVTTVDLFCDMAFSAVRNGDRRSL
ncbi:DNA helicase [Aureimonas flava]|uniref:DNA 5'-3' helicase n=1 Tax=Aureimonas flava TaxID=2320271 RepID=A0A3A1WS19_9HYPH|nr:DnaB-like helicase C-terminal domain-containing protein [Aureimonas flava]RIY03495.1 DNA helicase [Aureimonas flava]